MAKSLIAEVVFALPVDHTFDYIVPENLQANLRLGTRVKVTFGHTMEIGFCVGMSDQSKFPRLKEIAEVIDAEPLLSPPLLALARWMADYYLCSWGQALEAALPAGIRKRRILRAKRVPAEIDILQNVVSEPPKVIELTPEQQKALSAIERGIASTEHSVFLLYGITGSGKTEVYLRAIEKVVQQGQQAIVLVPEIALTPQTVSRFHARFPRIAVLHSRLTERERTIQWHHIKEGAVDVIIGARSAIFAPTPRLGLIVIDEEHENTYKQEQTPRYHTREAALKRAELEKTIVILGTATPSLESYHAATEGRFQLLHLPYRIEKRALPKIELIDMALEMAKQKRYPVLSRRMHDLIQQALEKKEQVLLFLNRRGFSTLITCARCGWILRCRRCDVALNYHRQFQSAVCHHCSQAQPILELCPECTTGKLRQLGIGTERVEEEIRALFPQTSLGRMDSDAMQTKKDYRRTLSQVWSGEMNLLIGTQMIAKGFDIPNVTFVGVVSADTAFHIPDFRSAERTFQLITQVAGRAGRGPKGGRVAVQTFHSGHFSLQCAARYDFARFAEKELALRRELGYPPFSHLIRLLLQGSKEQKVRLAAERFAEKVKSHVVEPDAKVVGPSPAPLYRIRGRFRVQILIKAFDIARVQKTLKELLPAGLHLGTAQLTVDVDPLDLM